MARNKQNEKGKGRKAVGVRRTCADKETEWQSREGVAENKCEALPPFTSGGCERQGLARGTGWKKFVETPRNWISRRGLFCQGFATRINVATEIAWSMVIGLNIACLNIPANFLLLAHSLARLLDRLRGNRQSTNPRQALVLLTSAARSMDRNCVSLVKLIFPRNAYFSRMAKLPPPHPISSHKFASLS